MDNLELVKAYLDYLVKIGTIIGGIFAINTYINNIKLRKAQWLYSLYEKFYESETYKNIRYIIDYERDDDINALKNAIYFSNNDTLVEELVDYLNFFEFIASLWVMKQLTVHEIAMLFEYYILRIYDHEFIVEFLKEEGFKQLPKLVYRLKEEKS